MLGRQIFRQEALDKLSSPEELDRLLSVVGLRAWVPLATLAGLCGACLVWAILGRIPITVEGLGVLVNPGNVKAVQVPTSGQLIDLHLRVGQHVAKGEHIGVLNQPELKQELEQEQVRLGELREHAKLLQSLDVGRRDLEKKAYVDQKKVLEDAVRKSDDLLKDVTQKQQTFAKTQRANLDQTRSMTSQLTDALQRRLESVRVLGKDKLVPADTVFAAESAYTQNRLDVANLEVKLSEISARETENAQQNLQQQSRISDLEIQLRQLEIKEQMQQQEFVDGRARRDRECLGLEQKIDRLKLNLEQRTQVVSEFAGRILEVSVSPGQILGSGVQMAKIECDDPNAELKALMFFDVQGGKQIREGMQARVTPATVQRQRYGAILGTVRGVSTFPTTAQGVVNIVGSQEIAGTLTQTKAMIEVDVDLQRDEASPTGFRWTSAGPPLRFSAGTTAKVRVTVEERAPITFVLPILEAWVFGSSDDASPGAAK